MTQEIQQSGPMTLEVLGDIEFVLPKSPLFRVPEREAAIAYLAGLMDGEGSINRNQGLWRIKIEMTDAEVIAWIAQFGGYVYFYERPDPRKPLYRWELHRKSCVVLCLKSLLPYMKLNAKLQRAKEVISTDG